MTQPFCVRLARHVLLVMVCWGLSPACGGGTDTATPDAARDGGGVDSGNDAPETGGPRDAGTDGDAGPAWMAQCGQGPPVVPDGPDVGSFCDVYSDIICASFEACSPSDFRRLYAGDRTACRAIERTKCDTQLLPSFRVGGASACHAVSVGSCVIRS